ncbi:MAG: chemotaxis protein CheW, partial [Gammaproteobacteria bacterium]|nr:chemotaxis protein CheW [Gammaproteobacteria bacterium]
DSSETTNTSEASTDETAESGESTGESKDDFAARMAKLEADLGGAEPVTIEASDETTNTSESRIAETDDSAESTGESKDDFTARMAKLEAELGGTEPVTSETSDETTNTSDAETTEAITLSQTNESISNTELIEEPQAPSSVIQTSPESSNTETDDSAISASTPESDETIDSATIQQATDETQINNIVEDRAQLSLPDTDAPQTSSSSIQTSSELSNLDSIESTDSISRIAPSEFITQDLQASLENETIDAIEAGHTDISKDTPSVSLDENEFTQDHETSFIAENHDQSILEEKDTITNSDITAQNHAVDEHGRFIAFSDEEYYDLLAQLYSEGDYANEDAVSSVSQAFVDTESRSNQSSANQDIIETTLGETANNTHSNSNLTQIAEANIPSDTTPSNENAVSEQEFKELFSDLLQTEAESSTASKEITQAELAAKTIKTAATEASVRVDSLMLDNIMNLVGELVLIRNQIVTLTNTSKNSDMEHSISQLDLLTGSLQDAVLKTRMQPIKQIFSRLPRVVRDTARKIGKEVFIHSHGDETELDKKLVELVADPIIHLVKNAIIHGIEIPEERVALNKAMAGTINISAINEADQIVLVIEDDGYGIDIERIRQRAIEIGLYNEAQAKKLSEAYLLSLLLNPEFATDPSTNDYSLSFINDQVNKLNGSITIETVLGKHTSIRLQIPLTLTILPALMVKSCNQIYALPLSGVCQIYNIQLSAIKSLEGEPVFVVRDKPIPIYFMHDLVGLQAIEHEPDAKAHVVTVDIGSQIIGVVVDDLIGQEEVVIKPLGNTLKSVSGVSGATITGGGAVALILELVDLVRSKRLAENEKKLKSKGVSNRHVHKQILRQLQKKYGSPEK